MEEDASWRVPINIATYVLLSLPVHSYTWLPLVTVLLHQQQQLHILMSSLFNILFRKPRVTNIYSGQCYSPSSRLVIGHSIQFSTM